MLFPEFFLNSATSISILDRNMIYRSPTVPKRSILASRAIKLKPLGPMMIPAIISPISGGMDILFRRMGEKRIMNRINEKIMTGFCNGKDI